MTCFLRRVAYVSIIVAFVTGNLAASDSDFGFLWICGVRAAAHKGEPQKLVASIVIGTYPLTAKHHVSFTIANYDGYAMIPLRPGDYCAEAYDTSGSKLRLDEKTNGGRPICFSIAAHKVAEAGLTIAYDVNYKPDIPSKSVD